ncbi:virus tail fibre assembly protein, lambda gpK [Luteibacter sp. UNC138MFCol5.1]|uniref:tail fiber assembly protein n=1 Tax=Luteibacter sp. UNC138MFCol5.1 TaxID=1502774 RepID=UPI0008D57C06|nr:tail fiber assembly protein [Luteibacter sp. UNC138MFCol5.1]SEO76138.1 virus tail fibre assembly protein, lambda gpK [Luteibacter sp. UNC138MFCol5.1]
MKTYARIDSEQVVEIITTDGDISEMFHPSITWVDVTSMEPEPVEGWSATNDSGEWILSPPVPYQPTHEEIRAANIARRNELLARAALAMAPLQDAVELGEATEAESALLTRWRQFRVAVSRVPLDAADPEWPAFPDPSYAMNTLPEQSA